MKKIRVDPMRFYPIEKLAREVYAQFITELLTEDISGRIADKTNNYYKLHSDQKLVEFTASRCSVRDEKKIELSGEVVATESGQAPGQPWLVLRSRKALLHLEGDEFSPTLTLELLNATWQRAGNLSGLTQRHIIHGLILPQAVTEKFKTEDILKSVGPTSTASALQKEPGPELKNLQDKLHRKIRRTFGEIDAEIHSRLVFGIGCVSLVMIGIGLGILKKGGHLLSAFGASSVPAAVLIVCIMMGKNIATNASSKAGSGIALMWAGLASLTLLAIVIYHRLLKN
jgi:hypothetical protein